MPTFLKYLLQLILSPLNGWNDLAERNPDPEDMLSKGLYPLMAVSALTELLALVYDRAAGLMQVLVGVVTDFGAYFLAVFLARLVLDIFMPKVCDIAPDRHRTDTFIVVSVGLMVLFRIIDNCLPWHIMLLKFLPLYVVLVMSKSFAYMSVRKRDEMRFLTVASCVIVAAPLVIYYLIYLLVQ